MNIVEKNLPKTIRDKMATMIVTALGLFLALQYNETIKIIIQSLVPAGEGILGRIIYTVALTIVIVYVTVLVEKGLDGK